jgi:hypothetical protein
VTFLGPYQECPRFDSCSVNQCPLDPLMLERDTHPDDPEKDCRASRRTRLAIAAQHPDVVLPTGGLTLAEVARDRARTAAKAKWDALPADHPTRLALKRNAGRLSKGDSSVFEKPAPPSAGNTTPQASQPTAPASKP